MKLRIESLGIHRALIPTVAQWHFAEWGHQDPEGCEDSWGQRLGDRAQLRGIPSYYVAFCDGTAVGSVGLCEHDMSTRASLSPWLSGLYVLPHFRRRGVGSQLVKHAMDAARDARVTMLYLHTARAEALYASLGWQRFAQELYEGQEVAVMSARLAA